MYQGPIFVSREIVVKKDDSEILRNRNPIDSDDLITSIVFNIHACK